MTLFRPLIHIGYPKTASTWVQNYFFNQEPLGFLSANRHGISEQFGLIHPLAFEPEQTKAYFAPFLAEAESKGLVPVISQELLAGNAYLNGGVDGKFYADALKTLFDSARIIIFIREQVSFCVSFYKMDVAYFGGFYSMKEFLDPKWHFLRRSQFLPRYLFYDHLISYYQDLFGKESVLVIPYEHLKQNRDEVLLRLLSFAGIPGGEALSLPEITEANVGRSALMVRGQRYWNRLFTARPENSLRISDGQAHFLNRRLLEKLDRVLVQRLDRKGDTVLRQQADRVLGDTFAASNRRTAALTGLDLAALGYRVDPSNQEGTKSGA